MGFFMHGISAIQLNVMHSAFIYLIFNYMSDKKELSKEEWERKKDDILSCLKGLTTNQAVDLLDYAKARLEVMLRNLVL
jgi:hypothetical protein